MLRFALWIAVLAIVVLASAACRDDSAPALVSPTVPRAAAASAAARRATATLPATATPPPAPTASPTPIPSPTAPPATPSATSTAVPAAGAIRPRLLKQFGSDPNAVVALSPNNAYLALGATAGWGLHSMPDLAEVWFEALPGVSGFRWSDDGACLAVLSPDGVSVYRIPDGARVRSGLRATDAVISPDCGQIAIVQASTSGSARVRFINSKTGADDRTLPVLNTDRSVTYSPDGALLATELGGQTLLWRRTDLSAKTAPSPLATVDGDQPLFSANGAALATRSLDNPSMVRVWRASSGELLDLFVFAQPPEQIAFHQDGAYLVGVAGRQIQIWDIAQQRLMRSWSLPAGEARLGPSGELLATFIDQGRDASKGIRFVRAIDGSVVYEDAQAIFDNRSPLTLVGWSADDKTAVFMTADGMIHAVNPAYIDAISLEPFSIRRVHSPPFAISAQSYYSVVFSPDGASLAAVQDHVRATLWSVNDPLSTRQFSPPKPAAPATRSYLTRVAFTPDGGALVAQDFDTAVANGPVLRSKALRWQLAGDQRAQTVWALNDARHSLELWEALPGRGPIYSPAAHAAAWIDKGNIRLQRDGGKVITLPLGSDQWAGSVAFSDDGRMLAASNGRHIWFFAIQPTVELRRSFDVLHPVSSYSSIVFSPDGSLAGLPASPGGQIWRIGVSYLHFGGNSSPARALIQRFVIGPDDRLIAAITADDITLYRLSDRLGANPDAISVAQVGVIPLKADEVAISPAGDRLAVISAGALTLWDIGS